MKWQILVILVLLAGTLGSESSSPAPSPIASSVLNIETTTTKQTTPTGTTPTDTTSTNTDPCSVPCEQPVDKLCYAVQDAATCFCQTLCCEPPICEYGYDRENCDCQNCPCLPPTTTPSFNESSSETSIICTEPCHFPNTPGQICEVWQNPGSCECHTSCCDLPVCENGIDWQNCENCNTCRCLGSSPSSDSSSDPSPSDDCSAPCPSHERSFCYNSRNQFCECEEHCCELGELCEYGVDFENCFDCFHCECIQPPSSEPSPSGPCTEPCDQPEDRFCFAVQDEQTCECHVACCSLPFCEYGIDWSQCFDCHRCPCLSSNSSSYPSPSKHCNETCPCSDKRFCDYVQEENCDCTEVCCEPPTCEGLGVDWKNCESCSNCPCLPPSSSEPCHSESSPSPDCDEPCPSTGSNFCFGIRDDFCVCQTVCCAPPECPGTGVDWPNCTSCSHCPCLPPSPESHECDHD